MTSLIYLTNRINPQFEWFTDSLCNQTTKEERDNLEVIFIDYALCKPFDHNGITRKELVELAVNGRFKFIHSTPKPNIYQGEDRKTQGEYFGAANARNTGIILSSGDYLAFVDDVSILMPTWWGAVKLAAAQKRIVCGAYQKHFDMVVENGVLKSSRFHQMGNDSRWGRGNGTPVKITGAQLFGCSLGIPAQDLLQVNGFDEICDSIGGEDYHLGTRLNNAGKQIWYDRKMLTIESEELHVQDYLMKREDRVLPPEKYLDRLKHYGVAHRKTSGNWDSSHMILDLLFDKKLQYTFYNNYSLKDCRDKKQFAPVNDQNHHWFDERPLIEML